MPRLYGHTPEGVELKEAGNVGVNAMTIAREWPVGGSWSPERDYSRVWNAARILSAVERHPSFEWHVTTGRDYESACAMIARLLDEGVDLVPAVAEAVGYTQEWVAKVASR